MEWFVVARARSSMGLVPRLLLTMLAGGLAASGCHGGASQTQQGTNPGEPSTGHEALSQVGPACGQINCAVGEMCCNASCSICTPPDGMCTQQLCEQEAPSAPPSEPSGAPVSPGEGGSSPVTGAVNGAPPTAVDESKTTCANVRCMAGTHCEMVQVQCVRAPCNPVPECKPDAASSGAGGVACGQNVCGAGQTCCNASCGICTDPGKGCIKMMCPDGRMPR
jgi:hypothetical protein